MCKIHFVHMCVFILKVSQCNKLYLNIMLKIQIQKVYCLFLKRFPNKKRILFFSMF